jgi:hypothetical protein
MCEISFERSDGRKRIMRTSRRLLGLAFMLLVFASPAVRADMSPPAAGGSSGSQAEFRDDMVTAVVVKSWGTDSGGLVWQHLNDNWAAYGATGVVIDYTTLHSVASFTLADLQANGADVVIVSDAAGGLLQWSADEVAALQAYADQGHRLVGTYAFLQYGDIDNRGLAPLWGLRSDLGYNTTEVEADATTHLIDPSHCVFTAIDEPLLTGGYPRVQVPAGDLSWDDGDLAGAVLLGRSANGRNAVTGFDGGNYEAYFISFMAEYQDGSSVEAAQWLYNAIVCGAGPSPATHVSWGALKQKFQ